MKNFWIPFTSTPFSNSSTEGVDVFTNLHVYMKYLGNAITGRNILFLLFLNCLFHVANL